MGLQTSGCMSQRPAPLLVEHQPSPQLSSQTDTDLELKIVSYNIWGLPSWMTGARHGRYAKIARELEQLDPDIILLQEAWTAAARRAAPTDGPWAIARAARQHTFFQQNGLVTLSRFPVLGGEFYPFTHAAFPDRLVHKGVLKVSVRLPDGAVLNIWNAHLQDGGSAEVRESQVHELLGHVQSAKDGQLADLVGGDFNCVPGSPLYQELTEALGPSMQQAAGVVPFVTWDGLSTKAGSGQTLDHIFCKRREGLQSLQADTWMVFGAPTLKQRLSDHFGIEAVMKINPKANLAKASRANRNRPQLNAGARSGMYADTE